MENSSEPGAAFAEQGGAPRTGRPVGQNLARFLRAHPDWGFGAFLLLFGIAFQIVMLFAEVAVDAPPLNDHVLHLLNVRRTAEAILTGADPTDPWLGQVALGYPLFHHYQHLPYLLPGALVALTRGALRAEIALRWVNYLLLCLFPLALYWSGRRLGLDRLAALFAGVAGPFIATNGLYGLDFVSYVWSGYGMYTQLWGMWLFALGLGQGYHTLRTGRGYLASVILVSAALLSHVVYAYMLLGSLGLAAILLAFLHPAKGEKWPSRLAGLKRFALLVGLMALVSAYFLVPFFRDRAYLNRSVWEYPWKYDSFGLPWVITTLFKGQLFDAGRFPSLTLLVLLGAVICFVRWQGERDRFLLILFVFWLLLYAGRPTWGALINLLPLSRDLHLHRLIGGVHLGGIYLMGIGLAWLWEAARRLRSREQRFLVPALLTLALLIPAYRERYRYLWQNARSMVETANAVAAERQDLDRLFQALRGLPAGRVYAGLPARWGKDIKVGAVPLYALLSGADFDTVGYLYHALSLNADIMVLFEDGRFEQYDLFNVRYVITPQGWTVPSYYRVLGDFGRFRLYGVETSGYFDLVSANAAFVGTRESFYPAASAWLGSPLVAAKDHPVLYLEKAPSEYAVRPLAEAPQIIPWMPFVEQAVPGRILWQAVSRDTYEASVSVEQACFLMLKVTYHPNWRAYVDGARAEKVMLMPSYLGVRLTPGEHTVRFEYRSGILRSLLGVLGLLILALVGWAERKPEWWRRLTQRVLRERPAVRPPVQESISLQADYKEVNTRTVKRKKLHRTELGLYLFLLAIYLISAAGHFFSTDHIATYLTAKSLVERHELALEKPINDAVLGRDGKYYACFGIGKSLADIPLYLVGTWVDRLASPEVRRYFAGVDLGDWGGTVPIFFVSLLNQCLTPLIAVIVYRFGVRLGLSHSRILGVALVYGLGTAAWVYARDSFQHPLETLLLLLTLYILYTHKGDRRLTWVFLAGCAFAGGVLTRVNLLLVYPAVAAYLLYLFVPGETSEDALQDGSCLTRGWAGLTNTVKRFGEGVRRGGGLGALLSFSLPIALVLGLDFYINFYRFGNIFSFHPRAQAAGLSTPLWYGLYGNLFSLGRSIFLYSPPIVLTFWAAKPFYREHRAEALLFGGIIAIYLLGYSLYGFWSGGWAWGPRFLVATLPYWVLPLGGFTTTRWRRILLGAMVLMGVFIQILGVAVNYSYVHWEWIRMNASEGEIYLFVPSISPVVMHWRSLIAGRNIDLWLWYVFKAFGPKVFALTLGLLLALLVGGLYELGALQGVQRATTWLRKAFEQVVAPSDAG